MSCMSGPNIVEAGLVSYLDASNPKSYPGTGLVWTDLSSSKLDFELQATGITFNATTKSFDLVNGHALYRGVITNATLCTFVFWMNTTELQALFYQGISGVDVGGAGYLGAFNASNPEYHSNAGTPVFYMDLVDTPNIRNNAVDGAWHMLEFKNVDTSTWTWFKFNDYPNYQFGNGSVSAIMIYDRALTADESAENYEALRSRFGI